MSQRDRSKDASHRRIRETASRMIRGEGISATSVHEVMRRSGLTVGGFYAHYASRDELLRDAFAQAVDERRRYVQGFLAERPREQWLALFMEQYLCDRHAKDLETGCAWAALLSELPRVDPATRREAERLFFGSVDSFARTLAPRRRATRRPGALSRREVALSSMALAFAHLALARMVADPRRKREILTAGRKAAQALAAARE